MVISLFFSQSDFPPQVHLTLPIWAHSFFVWEQAKTYIFNLYRKREYPRIAYRHRCAAEQSHENLHKVYWTHSAGLRHCFWPTEITILMHSRMSRQISRISNKMIRYFFACHRILSFERRSYHYNITVHLRSRWWKFGAQKLWNEKHIYIYDQAH